MPVTILTGARQTGKTTLAKHVKPERSFLTLDDLGILDQAKTHPDSLLANRPLVLDEVQRAPDLLLAVKQAVDHHRQAGDFLLTGSANLLLAQQASDTLAGRAVYLELPPFCPAEWLQKEHALRPLDALFQEEFRLEDWPDQTGNWTDWLLKGGYAPALNIPAPEDRALWFSSYVQTYLERDLRQLSDVASLPDFQRLMTLAAHRTARLLNQAEIARDAGLKHPTAHRYLNLLETGCLITKLRPYATNPSVGLVKSPKLLWTDCGLAASLAGLHAERDIQQRPDSGFWLEQTLYQTLQSWRALRPLQRRIHFWRNRSGREVDFLLEEHGKLVALEVKSGSVVRPEDTVGIETFRRSLPRPEALVRGVVLHSGPARSLGQNLHALPWGWMVPDA